MTPYDTIKEQISKTVPYAAHTGVELLNIADGTSTARLPERPETMNHIYSQHAGALFTLGEAASGAAMAGGFLPVITTVQAVAANAAIKYVKVAKGDIEAEGSLSSPATELLKTLDADGRVQFTVDVKMRDGSGSDVAIMSVDWHVSKAA